MSFYPYYIGTKVAAPPLLQGDGNFATLVSSVAKISVADISSEQVSSSTLSGTSITYLPSQIVNTFITRTPSSNTSDTLPTVTDLLSYLITNTTVGTSFGFSINNPTNYNITLVAGSGCTLYPTTIYIPYQSISKFNAVITSNTPSIQTYSVYQITDTNTSSIPEKVTTLTTTTTTTPTTALSFPSNPNTTFSLNTSIVTYSGNTNVTVAGDYQLAASFRNVAGTLTQIGTDTSLWANKNASLTLPAANINAQYSISGTNVNVVVTGMQGEIIPASTAAPSVPSLPVQPTFTGTIRAVPGTYATLAAAVTAASPGDIIEIAAGTTTNETVAITVSKSLEIRGANRATSIVATTTQNTLITISAGTNDVWIHDLTISNTVTGGVATTIGAQTVNATYPNGSTGLRFENLNVTQREIGITIGADSWVINNCYFTYSPIAGEANTSRHIINYQTYGTCFVSSCTFDCTLEATPRIVFLYLTSVPYASSSTGHTGNLVVSGNTQLVGNLRQFLLQDVIKQPGLNADPVTAHAFNLYLLNNNFGVSSGGNFILYETASAIAPLDFIGTLYISNNTIGSAASGLLKIDGTGTSRIFGTPTNLWVPSPNNITGTVTGSYVNGSTTDNLIGINTTVFFPPTDPFNWSCSSIVNST
jgi:hypothetical protein